MHAKLEKRAEIDVAGQGTEGMIGTQYMAVCLKLAHAHAGNIGAQELLN